MTIIVVGLIVAALVALFLLRRNRKSEELPSVVLPDAPLEIVDDVPTGDDLELGSPPAPKPTRTRKPRTKTTPEVEQ